MLSIQKFGGYKTGVKERIEERERLALRNDVKEEKHLEIYIGLREDIGMKAYLHGPMDYAKKRKLRFVQGPGPTRKKKEIPGTRYTSSPEEEGVATITCPCGTTIQRRTHIVGECEIYKEERDVLVEEMKKLPECDVEDFVD